MGSGKTQVASLCTFNSDFCAVNYSNAGSVNPRVQASACWLASHTFGVYHSTCQAFVVHMYVSAYCRQVELLPWHTAASSCSRLMWVSCCDWIFFLANWNDAGSLKSFEKGFEWRKFLVHRLLGKADKTPALFERSCECLHSLGLLLEDHSCRGGSTPQLQGRDTHLLAVGAYLTGLRQIDANSSVIAWLHAHIHVSHACRLCCLQICKCWPCICICKPK